MRIFTSKSTTPLINNRISHSADIFDVNKSDVNTLATSQLPFLTLAHENENSEHMVVKLGVIFV